MNRKLFCQQQAIEDGFDRLMRNSPRPLLINADESIFEEDDEVKEVAPPVVVRKRAPALISPLAKTVVAPHPHTKEDNYQDESVSRESLEELFDYLKKNVSDLSEESKNNSNNSAKIQSDVSNDLSASNIFAIAEEEISTLEASFSPNVYKHRELADRQGVAQVKDVSSTVYGGVDETDGGDTGYSTSNIRDFSLSGDEQTIHENTEHRIHGDNMSKHLEISCEEDGDSADLSDGISHSSIEDSKVSGSNEDAEDCGLDIQCWEIREDGSCVGGQNPGEDKEPCTLFMWIIKPVLGTQYICVEGKKNPDDYEFWKSGIIKERIDARTVVTQSDSIYKLQGNIEVDDAIYAGFARETVEAFKTGFPVNWQEVVDKHFRKLQLSESTQEEYYLTSTVTEEIRSNHCQEAKGKDYALSHWVVKPVGTGVCIVGLNSDGVLWHSSTILERISSKKLMTSNRSICTLKGHLDKLQAKEDNIPEAIINKFHSGFPKDWQELTQEHFGHIIDKIQNINEVEKVTSTVDDGEISVDNSNDVVKLPVRMNRAVSVKHKTSQQVKEKKTSLSFKEKKTSQPDKEKKTSQTVKESKTSQSDKEKKTSQTVKESTTSQNVKEKKRSVISADKSKNLAKENEYLLSEWLIKPLEKGICVVGLNHEGVLWHSSAIEKRLDKRRLLTSNGSLCRLKGHMDRLQAKEDKIPEAIVSKFHSGFPKEWQELTQEYFGDRRLNTPNSRQKINKDKSKNNKKMGSYCKTRHNKSKQEQDPKQKRDSSSGKEASRKTPSNKAMQMDTSVMSEDSLLDKTVLTTEGKVVNLETVKRSKSGRVLKPCVYWWAGQRVKVTEEGLVVQSSTEYGSRYVKEREEEYLNTSRVFRRYTYRKLNDTISSVSSKSSNSSVVGSKIRNDTTISSESSKSSNKSVVGSKVRKGSASSISEMDASYNENNKKRTNRTTNNSSKQLVDKKLDMKENLSDLKSSKSNQRSKLKQTATHIDAKLDQEIIVLLEQVKKDQLMSKQPKRSTCYDSSKKGAGTSSKDPYLLDESDHTDKERKNMSDLNLQDAKKGKNMKQVDDKQILEEDSSCPDTSQCPGEAKVKHSDKKQKSQRKSKSPVKLQGGLERSGNLQMELEQSKMDRKCKNQKKQNAGLKELLNLQIDLNDINIEDSEEPTKRVTRSKGSRSQKVDTVPINTGSKAVNSNRRTNLATISEVEELPMKTNKKVAPKEKKSTVKRKSGTDDNKQKTSVVKRNSGTAKNKEKTSAVKGNSGAIDNKEKSSAVKSNSGAIDNIEKKAMVKRKSGAIDNKGALLNQSNNGCVPVNEKLSSEKKKITSDKKTKASEKKSGKPKEVAITANKGTLKRKLQLKELLEHQNEDYGDNLFDSTPFRQSRKRKRITIDSMDDDAIFEELARKQGKSRFETPAGEAIVPRTGRLKMASARKTPAWNCNENVLESAMKNLDGYVHNLKKRQILHARRRRKMETPKSIKSVDTSGDTPQKKLFQEFLRADTELDEDHQDSDLEDDYYWDEETS